MLNIKYASVLAPKSDEQYFQNKNNEQYEASLAKLTSYRKTRAATNLNINMNDIITVTVAMCAVSGSGDLSAGDVAAPVVLF